MPFDLVLNRTGTLTEQVAEGFAKAIRLGRYKPGDVMPSTRNLAAALGVSRIVTRGAVRLLTEQGYISPRPGLGCVVAANSSRFWKGSVLFVVKNFAGSFYTNVLADVVRQRLAEAGYLFSQVVVPAGERWRHDAPGAYDLSGLEIALSQTVDLVVIMADSAEIASFVARHGVPFVVIGDRQHKRRSCVGFVSRDRGGAVPEFVRHCKAGGVRSVLQIGVEDEAADAVSELKRAGIAVRKVMVPVDLRYYWLEGAQRSAMDVVKTKLARMSSRPDLVFFTDDFIALGGMQAIDALGIAVPDELKVVTWANFGMGPVYRKTFTRMEADPYRHGREVAKYVLDCLKFGKPLSAVRLTPEYKIGDTFPILSNDQTTKETK